MPQLRHCQPIKSAPAKTTLLKKLELIKKASTHVETLFRERKPDWVKFHTFGHAKAVVKRCNEIGAASNQSAEDLEVVTIAAWFHDVGYVEGIQGHEERSLAMATTFLRENGYPEEKIAQVAACIAATKMPQNPKNLLEQILCDADLAHLASEDFPQFSERVRLEIEHQKGHKLTDREWLALNIDFVAGHRYFTDYARTRYESQRSRNLAVLRKELDRLKQRDDLKAGAVP